MHRIFHLRFNDRELIQEIYFLRQLSHDEAARKVGWYYVTQAPLVCWRPSSDKHESKLLRFPAALCLLSHVTKLDTVSTMRPDMCTECFAPQNYAAAECRSQLH
jgi:hypothetical protein